MQRLNQLYGRPSSDPSRCAVQAETHRSFTITVAAARRSTGEIIVNAILAGGPARIVRSFCLRSDARDATEACEQAVDELRRIVNHLLAWN